jgi:hypothetical protein
MTMIVTAGIGIAALVYRSRAGELVEAGWQASTPETRDELEKAFFCCGLRSPSEEPQCPVTPVNGPCYDDLVLAVDQPLLIVGVAGVVLGGIQLFALIAACVVGANGRRRK